MFECCGLSVQLIEMVIKIRNIPVKMLFSLYFFDSSVKTCPIERDCILRKSIAMLQCIAKEDMIVKL